MSDLHSIPRCPSCRDDDFACPSCYQTEVNRLLDELRKSQCGHLSAFECNKHRQAAARLIEELQQQLNVLKQESMQMITGMGEMCRVFMDANDATRAKLSRCHNALRDVHIEAAAKFFHDTYEQLAPNYGYQTRQETRMFDAESPNGRLMLAVIASFYQRLRDACGFQK